jgi:2-dehydro-3-deoxyphosphooctonate aldolase (KDO 8-P synthase)
MENQPLFERLKAGPFFILGPCVIESRELLMEVGEVLAELKSRHGLEIIFKSSFDKANRTSVKSFRGPGLEKGLALLAEVKRQFGLPILTDIHEAAQAAPAAEVADILQIPAFLCRQTDLLLAAGETGRIVNIKKGQFLSGADMQFPAEKVASTGNQQILLTERGNMYGYNNLVVDFRNIPDMQAFGYPVVMDCTHSVQRPGGAGGKTGGNREFVPAMARAAGAFGADGYFLEVHPHPPKALSDGPNMLFLKNLEPLLLDLMASGR